MSEVVFITPNTTSELAVEAFGTLQLATILNQNGIKSELLQFFRIGDLSDFDSFVSNALRCIEEIAPKIVSFYTRCDVYHIDIRLAEQMKRRFPEIVIVFGGPQSDIVSEETLADIESVDYICCGEGENTIFPFFSSLLAGTPDLTIPGLVYRENGCVKKNPRPELMEDLDRLPMIDYSMFGTSDSKIMVDGGYFPVDVGRGCPFGCSYCSTKTFWGRRYRLKSPRRICDEIRELNLKFGITRFYFTHDMFTLNRARVVETCELLKSLDFPIEWRCSARLDCIDHELIDIMTDAGMRQIFIGIETGSPRMQKLINKNLKLDKAVELAKHLVEKKVDTIASFIYGFPEETEEDLVQTMNLIIELLELRSIKVQTHLCTFLAGTELADKYKTQLTKASVFSNITGNVAVKECRDIIEGYPALFSHLQEYKTELRTKLQYFSIFFAAFKYMLPVYLYLTQRYPENQRIDMYYDFVDSNEELLKTIIDLPQTEWYEPLVKGDRFYTRFSEDGNYDIISDLYRFWAASVSEMVKKGQSATGVYCFSPDELKKGTRLEEFQRDICVVSIRKDEGGTTRYRATRLPR